MEKTAKIYIAGHRGMVGSALLKQLQMEGYNHFVFRTSKELDLRDQAAVHDFFEIEKPEYVFLAAAKVGGIVANNSFRADFLYDNLMIQANVIHSAYRFGTRKLLFLGSSCIYPKSCPQPIREDYLLSGPLEPTNEAYALAKISGLKLIEAYRKQFGHKWISAMPTNLYGQGDNFDLENSHVLPAMIRKFHDAKVGGAASVTLWGDGTPMREFLHADDLALACLHLLANYDDSLAINVGTGKDITIKDLASTVSHVVGFSGEIVWDKSRPNGTPRKLLDVSRIRATGWSAAIELPNGLASTYNWFTKSKL